VFSVSATRTYRQVADFGTQPSGPVGPIAGLVEGTDHVFYGVAPAGGLHGDGALYRVRAWDGAVQTLHDFGMNAYDGQQPSGPLLLTPDGRFFGTTKAGGTHHAGTIFDWSRPPAERR
jgi:hypothetical protein